MIKHEVLREQFERLERAVVHIESGEWSVPIFDFGTFRERRLDCGTSHCWAGEFPSLFPKDWFWWSEWPMLRIRDKRTDLYNPADCMALYFGLTEQEVQRIFYPVFPRVEGLIWAGSTREEVAANGRAFLEERRTFLKGQGVLK